MSEKAARKNIFLTDENVDGPAIRLARSLFDVSIVRDVDIELACEIDDYDQCLFDYAAGYGYVIVTENIKHFEPKFYAFAETGRDHPGMLLIRPEIRTSTYVIAEWLGLLSEEDLTNRLLRLPFD